MNKYSVGIRCDYLLTMKGGRAEVLRDHFVGVSGSKIVSVEPWIDQNKLSDKFISARDQVVMPGLVNGHAHLAMNLLRGIADDLPFDEWLYKYIFPLESQKVSAEFVRVGTRLALHESIRSGVTTLCDMYYFADVVAECVDEAGVRAIVTAAALDFSVPDNKGSMGVSMRSLEKLLAGFRGHERITSGLGPHAPYTVSDETWKTVRELALKHDLRISTHVAETEKEVRESFEKHGKSPVARLSDLGILELKPTMAHCVHLSEADIDLIARSGAGPVHNPQSNMKLAVGVAPVVAMLKAGINVGLGTDGAVSNNDLNLFREMDTAVKLQKLERRDSTAMRACDGLRMATWGGARALGLGDQVGSIEVGKFADIIGVGLARSNMQPVFDVLSQLVYATSGDEVEWSMCHGKMIMENAKPLHLDWPSIIADTKQWQAAICADV